MPWDHSTSPYGIDTRAGVLEGLDDKTGHLFEVRYLRQIHARGLELGMGINGNDRDIHLETEAGQVWAGEIPAQLQ